MASEALNDRNASVSVSDTTGSLVDPLAEFDDLPDTAGMDIIDAMLAEHQRILVEADDLEHMALELMTEGIFDLHAFQKKVRFIRRYADAAHHRKEEDVLFSHMIDTMGTIAENLVKHGMMVEHDLGRMCVKNMEDSACAFADDPSDMNRLDLVSWSMEYVHLIRRHIAKENDVVYPFARRSLSAEVIVELSRKANDFAAVL